MLVYEWVKPGGYDKKEKTRKTKCGAQNGRWDQKEKTVANGMESLNGGTPTAQLVVPKALSCKQSNGPAKVLHVKAAVAKLK